MPRKSASSARSFPVASPHASSHSHHARSKHHGGKPCIRGLRVTVGTLVSLVAAGRCTEEILRLYPYLEADDIREALSYAAWRVEEIEVPLAMA